MRHILPSGVESATQVPAESSGVQGRARSGGKVQVAGDFYMETILGKIKMFMGCMCVCSCVQVCMWRAEVNLRCPSSSSVHLGLLRWVWNSPVQPSQLSAPGTLLSPPSQCWDYVCPSVSSFLMWMLGIELRYLRGKPSSPAHGGPTCSHQCRTETLTLRKIEPLNS